MVRKLSIQVMVLLTILSNAVANNEFDSQSFAINNQKYYDNLLRQDNETLFVKYIEVNLKISQLEKELIARALAQHLNTQSGNKIYHKIADTINQKNIKLKNAGIALLKKIYTPEALEIILHEMKNDDDVSKRLLPSMLHSITQRLLSEGDAEKMATMLIHEIEYDVNENKEEVILKAIANLGTEEGVEYLFQQIEENGHNHPAYQNISNIKRASSLAPIERRINSNNDVLILAAGSALSSIGSKDSVDILIKWAESAPKEYANYIAKWLAKARYRDARDAVYQAGHDKARFVSEEVYNAVKWAANND